MMLKYKVNALLRHPGCNGSSGGSSTTVQKADPWEPIQPFLLEGANAASDLYNANPGGIQPYTGEQVATLPSWLSSGINSGIQSAMGSTPFFQDAMWSSLAPALNPSATGFLNVGADQIAPGSINPAQMGYAQVEGSGIDANPAINTALYGNGMSPYLDQMANSLVDKTTQAGRDAATNIYTQLQNSILPGIQDDFQAAGSLGASRQALMQGNAIGQTNDALAREMGDLSTNLMGQLSNLYGGVYENAQNRSASLASQMAGLGTQERLAQANLIQQMLGTNAGFSQDAAMANLGAYMQAMGANQGANLQASLANQGTGLEAQGLDLQKTLAQMQTFPMLQQLAQFPMMQNSLATSSYAPLLMQDQALMDVDKNAYYEQAMAPWNALSQYASLVNPTAGMGGTSTNTQPTYSNPLAQTLGALGPLAMLYFMA